MQKLTYVCRALRNKKVVRLLRCAIYSSYGACLGSESEKILSVTDIIIDRLVLSQKAKMNTVTLKKVSVSARARLILNTKYKKLYGHYKREDKPQYEFSQIKKYLRGNKIMDFGCGDGLFATYISRKGYDVSGTDTKDYRVDAAKNIHFLPLKDYISPPSHTQLFDTTIIKSVLHHIDARKIESTIRSIVRNTSKRVLIKEDVILELFDEQPLLRDPKNNLLEQYFRFSHTEKLQFLALMDFFGNYITQGLSFIEFPFAFRTVGGWGRIFKKTSLTISKVIPSLFSTKMLHTGPHAWFICDVRKA
ncbi:class I SAM-dependent methyltransferase [Candidatus Woesebacteria bacterium]|nr:class I SAM-dependent methyltransferase [Candidatus Woesebacteria bacterium]